MSSGTFNYDKADFIMSIGLRIFLILMAVMLFMIHSAPRPFLVPEGLLKQIPSNT